MNCLGVQNGGKNKKKKRKSSEDVCFIEHLRFWSFQNKSAVEQQLTLIRCAHLILQKKKQPKNITQTPSLKPLLQSTRPLCYL